MNNKTNIPETNGGQLQPRESQPLEHKKHIKNSYFESTWELARNEPYEPIESK